MDAANRVIESGVTVPFSLIQNPPTPVLNRVTRHAGHDHRADEVEAVGPAGAFVVVDFPDVVKQTTYLNHFELHWNPAGHPPDDIYGAAHFDLHFYNDTVAQVLAIAPPDPVAPASNRIPTGYVYAGAEQTVPQMGVHAVPLSDLAPGAEFSASMILGYYNGRMNFVEPMITQNTFLSKQAVTLTVPQPAVLGQATRYPTKFTATYDAAINAYQCTFSEFVNVSQ
jgi:hypothetical protein